jgi:hypothetical protein
MRRLSWRGALCGLVVAVSPARGQSTSAPAPARVVAARAELPPLIDGRLDDPLWHDLAPITDFWKMRPVDDERASERTEAWIAYDHKVLYIAVRAYEAHPGTVRASRATRDQIFNDDWIAIFLDTFHDRRRGYLLFVNPLGIQADGVVAQGQDDDMTPDFVWHSMGERTEDGFTLEVAIPFRSLRFRNATEQTWGIAIIRLVSHASEQQIFPRVDMDDNCLLCQTATLTGVSGVRSGRTFELLPTVTGLQRGERAEYTLPWADGPVTVDAGLGVKYGVTPSLTADVALNPDFSHVESDAGQVEVNQRFALFFPEKRPFFLEGQDIFGTPIQLVYTRAIFDPLVAGKVTGKVGRISVGLLLAVDETPMHPRGDSLPTGASMPDEYGAFTIVRVKQDVGRNNALGVIATGREFAGSFNRVAGVDGQVHFLKQYSLQAQAVWSDTRNLDGTRVSEPAFGAFLSRNAEHLQFQLYYNDVAPDFRADAGFIRRTDLREAGAWVGWRERPNGRVLRVWQPSLSYRRLYDHAGVLQDDVIRPGVGFELARQTNVWVSYSHALERFADVDFRKDRVSGEVFSAPTKLWSGGFFVEQGQQINFDPDSAYLGYSRDLGVFSTLRPTDGLSVELSFRKSTFWRERGGARVFDVDLVRGRVAYQFSKELLLRMIAEWNDYDRTIDLYGLLSYTANPGTVFFLGVDNGLERPDGEVLRARDRTVFFKASYLWRL